MTGPLDADVVVLTSRFAPERDGGYAVAVLSRLLALHSAGVRHPLLLTLDVGSPRDRERAVAYAHAHGVPAGSFTLRNLFDEVVRDPRRLRAQARPGGRTPGVAYRELRDDHGALVVSLPVVADAAWHLSEANVVIHGGEGDRVLPGFAALYVAWLSHVADDLRAAAGDAERRLVVICESRQIGETLGRWCDPRVRIVHTVHNSHLAHPFDAAAPVRDEGWRRWLDALDGFDLVLWPTRAQAREVDERFPHRVRFATVPSAILPRRAARVASCRRDDVVVMACRLVEQKRIDLAIRAWEEVVRERPGARLEIYGDGPLREHLRTMVRERGLQGAIRLRGHDDDVRAAIERARVFLSTSAFEGQGLAIVEALSAGVPVVSTDVRYGPAEVIGDGGILVPAGDVAGIAAGVVSLLGDDDQWERASAEARRSATRFRPEVVGARLREELDAVLARPAGRLCALAGA
ncbi:glycosyltransferase [Microbacterium sp. RURRCA19A]|uniref:glycosyltransferase n=1 Tax=Microbacterium sp. RURRCA19A TaxID=1907391 RepID=UPI000957546E|nr:glycosyltransferase [Microbacterium sp. RURRCA19A]SIS11151.1 Glycosyltransferase involved in cell wall bisynthesis [Microbacterium sp. RURRCA19A]